ncbi:cation:proton antiporter [uncultured Paraglaciecola sp.]|uniref:cation:proton antiporter n=1 Tax=uncultured Paraglaciecola sp. TaxID=1765024 RepID=UPI0030DA89DD
MLTLLIWLLAGFLLVLFNPVLTRARLPQAAVAIIVGLLLGPFYLNWISYGEVERSVTEWVVVFILFAAGFEIRWTSFIAAIKPGMMVGLAGIALSMLLGFMASFSINNRLDEALYVGVALSATSIGLSVPILHKVGLINSKVGQILLAAAIVDDILVLYLLAAVHVGLTGSNGLSQIAFSLLFSLFVLVLMSCALIVMGWLLNKSSIIQKTFVRRVYFVVLAIIAAWVTQRYGLSAVVGGFVAGAIFAYFKHDTQLRDVSFFSQNANYITPLFFLSVGMQITVLNFSSVEVIGGIMLILLAAILGKLFSPWVIASRLNSRERWLLGMALVPRAEVALIVASIGFQQQHLSHHTMIALVVMTLVTALLSASVVPILAGKLLQADPINPA